MDRSFDYHGSLPYSTQQPDLDAICERLESLHAAGEFQRYAFGTAYAPEAATATRDLASFLKCKYEVPRAHRLRLTNLFLRESLNAVEPSLFVRYGSVVLSLWHSSRAQQELREMSAAQDLPALSFVDLGKMVRNVVVLADSRPLLSELTVRQPDRLSGLGGSTGTLKRAGKKPLTPCEVALMLAKQFAPLFPLDNTAVSFLNNEILAFLGSASHYPSQETVVAALVSLIPFRDPNARRIVLPLLCTLWTRVTGDVAGRFVLPAVAEFAVYDVLNPSKCHDIKTAAASSAPAPASALGGVSALLPLAFQNQLHAMQIPLISAQRAKKPTKAGGDAYSFAKLVVWSISKDERALDLLANFVNAVLSFCHPSNVGVWTSLVMATLSEIAAAYIRRVNIEGLENTALTAEDTKRLVLILKQPVLMAVYSSSPVIFAQAVAVVRLLAWLQPALVVTDVLALAYPTLHHGLHQPQRLMASIACLEQLARPLTSDPLHKMHLTTLLELTLPNLDANDAKRCFLCMSLFQTVAGLTVFEDSSNDESIQAAAQILPMCVRDIEDGRPVQVSVQDAKTVVCGTSAAFPELLSVFMNRIFELIKTTAEPKLGSAASSCVLRVLLACSDKIFSRLLDITLTEIVNPQQQSYDAFAQVCGAFVRADCFRVFPVFWKLLNSSIREEITENLAGKRRVVMPRDSSLVRYLSVLNMCLLAANPKLLIGIQPELRDLLHMLRAQTGLSVVYTVANTIHHAIVALTGYSIMLPSPTGEYRHQNQTHQKQDLNIANGNIVEVPFKGFKWNTPSAESREVAIKLYEEHLTISKQTIDVSIGAASSSIPDSDAVSSALIFLRTTTGAIASLVDLPEVHSLRDDVAQLLLDIYPKIGRDDVSSLKEVLFVAKVLLCDFKYERTARLDSHQTNLYIYEKRQFEIPGNRKASLPPVILARRAQLFHNQCLAIATQHRKWNDGKFAAGEGITKRLIFEVLLDACFNIYPAVTRNALSALYSPLKIFNDSSLYLEVYETILNRTDKHLANEEFEQAEGGFSLLKYRSFGLQTVGKSPKHLKFFVQLCMRAVAADRRQLITHATQVFFYLLPDVFRVGIQIEVDTECWSHIQSLIAFLIEGPLESQHWREALLRTSALLMVSICPQLPLNSKMIALLLGGLHVDHPDVWLTAVLACLNVLQTVFWTGMVGFNIEHYKVAGSIEVPFNVKQSKDKSLHENDLSAFIKRAPLPVVKSLKTQPRPNANLLKFAAQANEPDSGFWRIDNAAVNLCTNNSGNNSENVRQINQLPMLAESDKTYVSEALDCTKSNRFWKDLFELRKLEPRNDEDKLNKAAALLFRNLVSLSCLGFGSEPSLLVHELLRGADLMDKNWHRVAAEVLCGVIMALPLGDESQLNKLIIELLNDDVVASISSDNVAYWTASLGFAVPNIDHQRLKGLISRIETISHPSTSSDGGGIKLSLRTALHTEIMDSIGTRKNSLMSVAENWPHWNHSLQTTRETAVEEVVTAVSTTMNWQQLALSNVSDEELVQADVQGMKLDSVTLEFIKSLFQHKSDKSDISLLGLILNLLHAIGGNPWIEALVCEAFPLLLRLSAVRDDPEILELVTHVFSELSVAQFSGNSIKQVVDLISSSVTSDQWHQRMRMLLFTQSFFFNHLLVMSPAQRMELTQLAVVALTDLQAEVRELAADTLSGIVRCSPPSEQREYVEQLTTTFKKLIGKKTELVQRHGAVLGLGAVIGAFPYTSPPPAWIPDVLASIASRAAGDSGIVGKSAKQVLSDFKKTRQDTWHIDQLVFSQDQLDDLDGVLWRNYFA